MYMIDALDEAIEMNDAPQPDSGAPFPFVMSDEHRVLLAYMAAETDPDTDNEGASSVRTMTADSPGHVAFVEFARPSAHMWGPPNDETFTGHPLAERGLHPYGVFEVKASSWIRQLERMGSVHEHYNASRYRRLRHYIFSFHDSTFECVAESFTAALREGSVRDAMFEMLQRVQGP